MPVFKTGALGRYASPPWGSLPEKEAGEKSTGIKRVNLVTAR